MTRDFTYEIYEELLQAGMDAGYEHIPVREYLDRKELPNQFIIHRHDVDRKPENALEMARLEAKYDISTTYYFRTIDKTYKPDLIREIEELGHEIGYHYEDMDRADGNLEQAHESFADELERVRQLARVETVCMHGNPLTSHDNRDMWDYSQGFDDYDLRGEAYLSMDFVDVTYFSDTGRTWEDGDLKIKDHPVGESQKQVQVGGTSELIELVSKGEVPRLCLLSHPNRWAATNVEYVAELAKDTTTNIGKIALTLIR
ncbi:hypothetical protein CV102_18100 [Natronococcus pandeyae]|uniref:Polysaccharide deacetylase n=1 Tax=Natronococcus pandeyae TaxID=2055836 RepID=A0A8J8Q2D4_9EURY|nr:hypothetical protein [Natronococcus pandeyae]TYL37228.1 hypothetical protein CV102_18100 [Natronococcus pandeyae]